MHAERGYHVAHDGLRPRVPSTIPCEVCGHYALEPLPGVADRLACVVCGAHRLGTDEPGSDPRGAG